MKFTDPEVTQQQREHVAGFYQRHFDFLRQLQLSAAERAMQFLILTNGGGLIAILGFMGAAPTIRSNPASWWVAGIFLSGVVLCGVLAAINFEYSTRHLFSWIADTEAVYRGEADADLPGHNLNASIAVRKKHAPILGYLAFGTFIAGGVTAMVTLPPRHAMHIQAGAPTTDAGHLGSTRVFIGIIGLSSALKALERFRSWLLVPLR